MHTSMPSGMVTVTFFRLWARAPISLTFRPVPVRLCGGIGMRNSPLR